MKKLSVSYIAIMAGVALFAAICLYPFLLVISGSLTTTEAALKYGFTLIPKEFTTAAYEILMSDSADIIQAYKITIFVTALGTTLAVFIDSMMAYVLSRKMLFGKKIINIYVLITMLFSGGIVTWYLICTRYLGLTDTIWALIIPKLVSAWNIFLVRNYFTGMGDALHESAVIDGAGEFLIFRKIFFPLATPVLATITLFSALGYWNDWWLSLMLIEDTDLYPLQMLLRQVVANIQFLQSADSSPEVVAMFASIPGDAVKMALVLVTTGPILLLYPFVQKYFVKGIMVGSVKG